MKETTEQNNNNNTAPTVPPGEEHLLLDHNYDGICELDHPLPRWWLATFYGAILFSIGYYIYFASGLAPTQKKLYTQDVAEHQIIRNRYLEAVATFNNEKYQKISAISEMKDYGEKLYIKNCMACHAEKGAGDIGPNLTDAYWLYSEGTAPTIFPFIVTGNPLGGMPAWGEQLDEDDIYAILNYILSLQGTVHKKAKAPQGEKFPQNTTENSAGN